MQSRGPVLSYPYPYPYPYSVFRIRIRIRMVDAGTEDATVPTERCATTVRKTVRSRDEFVLFDVDVAVAVSRNRARNRNRRAGIR